MTETNPQPEPLRIPIGRKITYAVRGMPPVANTYGPGFLLPTEVSLTYRATEDSQLGRFHAYVKGQWLRDGEVVPSGEKLPGQHYNGDPTAWPGWLAEEARLHDPDAPATVAPAVWIDGHPQLEAIAAAVWERCGRSDSGSCIDDDPRNIAVAALAAVSTASTACLNPPSAGQHLAIGLPPAGRVAALRDAAEICDEAGAVYASNERHDQAGVAYRLMERLLRKADEAEYMATPCSVGGCEDGGEPCSTHERLMAHAEGDHELCAPGCGTTAAETAGPETQAEAGTVAYRSNGGRLLRCLQHAPEWATILIGDFHPVTSDDLPDGGICTYPDCGVDVLIPPSAAVPAVGQTDEEA